MKSPTQSAGTRTAGPRITELRGRQLLLARVAWAACAMTCLTVVVGCIPIVLRLLQMTCENAPCIAYQQLTADGAQAIQQLGLSVTTYGVLSLCLILLTACVWFGVGFVIAWRKSDERMAWLLALVLVFQGAQTVTNAVQNVPSFWELPSQALSYAGFLLLYMALLLFPDGRFTPRWTRWLVIIWAIALWFRYFISFPETLLPPFLLLWTSLLFSLFIIQTYRYRRVSTPVQRQQTKWVLLGVSGILLFEIAAAVANILFPALSQSGSLAGVLMGELDTIVPILLPVSIGIAILRSRLWDIDVIINKALVYGTLTALLAAVYAALIIGLESLAGLVTRQAASNPLVLVVSTLVIIVLFNPLRHRIQATIDRRFYRRKYDAAKTLAAFGATLRTETDLSGLSQHLVAVVDETMQPEHVSLWLRPQDRRTEGWM